MQSTRESSPQMNTDGSADFGDGTSVRSHHSQRMCFPASAPPPIPSASHLLYNRHPPQTAVPFVIPKMPTFREATNTKGVNFSTLSYTNSCKTETVRDAFRTLNDMGLTHDNPWAPVALLLRTGEAIDAVRNFAGTGTASTGTQAAVLLVCGVMQLGGVLYLAMLLPICSLLILCLPCVSATAIFLLECFCCLTVRRPRMSRRARTFPEEVEPLLRM